MDKKSKSTLHQRLEETYTFPANYTFKFIVPSDPDKITAVEALFQEDKSAKITQKKSAKDTFTSLTIRVLMDSPEAILKKYEDAASIPKIISL